MQRQLQEVIVAAAGPSSASQGSGTVNIYDLNTGSSLFTLKQTLAAKNCTVATSTRDGQGGLVFAAQSDKGLLNVYSYQKDQLHLRIVLPEKLTCFAVDNNGEFCAGGTQNGRVYLWEIASGILFNSWEAHYRRIGVIKFTSDGSALVTGSDDSHRQRVAHAFVDNALSSDIPDAYYTLTDHTLPITDIITDLATRSLLSTFQFPQPITSIVLDVTERILFASSPEGLIYQVNLYRPRKENLSQRKENAPEVVGGGGHGSAELIALEEDAEKRRLITVGSPVNCMQISSTSSLLIVGNSKAQILLYDISSHQLIRTISVPKDFQVNSLQVMLKPQDLMGHATIGAGKNDNVVSIRSITAFQRSRDPKARAAHEVLILPPSSIQKPLSIASSLSEDDLLDDYRFFANSSLSTSFNTTSSSLQTPTGPVATARITELEKELAALRLELTHAKELNTSIYESALAVVFGDKKSTAAGGAFDAIIKKDNVTSDGRPSKRGRAD